MRKLTKKNIFYFLCLIGLIYIISLLDMKSVLLYLKNMPRVLLFLCLTLQLVTMLLLTIQLRLIVSWVKKDFRFIEVLKINIKGNIVDSISPGVKIGGEVARIYEMRRILNLDYGQAVIITGLQKTISITSFLLLTIISLIWFYFTMDSKYKIYLNLFLILLFLFLLVLVLFIFVSVKVKSIEKLLSKTQLKDKWIDRLGRIFLEYRSSLEKLMEKRGKLIGQLLLGIFIWILYAVKMYIVVKGLKSEVDIISLGAITYLSYMAGMIPLLPGGLGSFEGSMVTLLAIKGVTADKGVAISVIFRFITFWFELGISLIILALNKIIRLFLKDDKHAKSSIR